VRISELFGRGPDDDEQKKQAEAIAVAIATEMKKEAKAIETDVAKLIKNGADRQAATQVALSQLTKALEKTAERLAPKAGEGEAVLTAEQIEEGFSNVSDAIDEQNELFRQSMKNDEFRMHFTEELFKGLEKGVTKAIDKEILSNANLFQKGQEIVKEERSDRKRREQEGKVKRNAKGEKDGLTQSIEKLIDFLTLKELRPGGAIGKAIENVGLGLGAVGLASMLPDQVRKTIEEFTGAFSTIRTLFHSRLSPIFKLLERFPIVGALVKKIPYINAFLFFFENFTDIAKKFADEGWQAGAKLTLTRLYDFFGQPLTDIVGRTLDKLDTVFNGQEDGKDRHRWSDFGKRLDDSVRKFLEAAVNPDNWTGGPNQDPGMKNFDPGKIILDAITKWVKDQLALGHDPKERQAAQAEFEKVVGGHQERARKGALGIWDEFAQGFDDTAKWFHEKFLSPSWLVSGTGGMIRLAATGAWDALGKSFDDLQKWFSENWKTDEPSAAGQVGAYLMDRFSDTIGWLGDQWKKGLDAVGSVSESIAKFMQDLVGSLTSWLADQFKPAKWFSGADDYHSENAYPPRPTRPVPFQKTGSVVPDQSELDKSKKIDRIVHDIMTERRRRHITAPVVNRVDNSRKSSTVNYSVQGVVRANKSDPLSTSTGR
jgi:hypothetical protein